MPKLLRRDRKLVRAGGKLLRVGPGGPCACGCGGETPLVDPFCCINGCGVADYDTSDPDAIVARYTFSVRSTGSFSGFDNPAQNFSWNRLYERDYDIPVQDAVRNSQEGRCSFGTGVFTFDEDAGLFSAVASSWRTDFVDPAETAPPIPDPVESLDCDPDFLVPEPIEVVGSQVFTPSSTAYVLGQDEFSFDVTTTPISFAVNLAVDFYAHPQGNGYWIRMRDLNGMCVSSGTAEMAVSGCGRFFSMTGTMSGTQRIVSGIGNPIYQNTWNYGATVDFRPNVGFCSGGLLAATAPTGLGDTVASLIQRATFGTVKPCGGCKDRQAKLNRMFPYR